MCGYLLCPLYLSADDCTWEILDLAELRDGRTKPGGPLDAVVRVVGASLELQEYLLSSSRIWTDRSLPVKWEGGGLKHLSADAGHLVRQRYWFYWLIHLWLSRSVTEFGQGGPEEAPRWDIRTFSLFVRHLYFMSVTLKIWKWRLCLLSPTQ